MEDGLIVELMKKGEDRALAAVMEKYRGLAYSVARSVLGGDSEEDAWECVNSAFHDLWLSAPSYDEKRASLKGWVALLARRRAVDLLRKNIRRTQTCFKDFSLSILDITESPEEYLERGLFVEAFNEFVGGLTEPNRSIFVRRYFSLETITAIAARYGLSRGAVDSRLSRLRKALKEHLEGSGQCEGKRNDSLV